MRVFLVCSFIFVSSYLYAQVETQRSVSLKLPVTAVQKAKPFLTHQAVLDAIKDHANDLGIDGVAFETKLLEKFESYFKGYKERKISEKFGKDYSKNLTEDQKKTFLDGIDSNRFFEYVRFSKLDRLLDSYAFRQIANDQKSPYQWNAVMVLKLSNSKVQKFFSKLNSTETKQYSNLQILTEINLIGLSWADLSLEKSSTFTDPMLKSWLKWFSRNPPENVQEITLCDEQCHQDFSAWQLIPQEEGMAVPEQLLNGLWLKISFNLRKVSHSVGMNEWEFEWDGSVVLLDVNTKKNLFSYTLQTERKTWRGLDQKALNSALVSAIYRSPLDALTKVVRKVQEGPRLNQLSRLSIQGHRHLGDVLFLTDSLKKEGSKIGLELSLDLFTRNEAQLLCFYQGEEKSFTDLLSQLKELKSSQSYKLINEFNGVHNVLKLIAE